eukprot:359680-Chlamydomonas_euryale.AAC.2
MASGKVEIGAFRTYPEGYRPPDEGPSEYQTIPLSKIEDFGVHAKQYYSLDVSFFKSSLDAHMLDLLWNKVWGCGGVGVVCGMGRGGCNEWGMRSGASCIACHA